MQTMVPFQSMIEFYLLGNQPMVILGRAIWKLQYLLVRQPAIMA
jgi:hypothetical protein